MPKRHFLTSLAASGKQIFATKDAYEVLGEGKATRDALARLVDKGWLERIEKGKYLIVPLEAGPDRTWTEDAYVIAGHLVSHAVVGYWSALNYWKPHRAGPPRYLRADDRAQGTPHTPGSRDAVSDRPGEA